MQEWLTQGREKRTEPPEGILLKGK